MKHRAVSITWFGLVFTLMWSWVHVQAHDTWVVPEKSTVQAGESVVVRVASGHHFPEGGDSLPREDFKTWIMDPSGKTHELALKDSGRSREGSFSVTAKGRHEIHFEHTPPVQSKTTRGWVAGDRQAHPEAIKTVYFYSSGSSSFLAGMETDPRRLPNPLKFHLAAHIVDDQVTLTARLDGQPAAGVKIRKITPSGSSAAGVTDERGRLVIVAPDWRGNILFSAHYNRKPVDADADYDEENYHTTLVIHF
jgi:hypothetical protein